jgi:hypothetical protein
MSISKKYQLAAIIFVAAVVVINFGRGASGAETQDVNSLDRRISMLEQRFYSLETGMNRLQQVISAQRSAGSSSELRDREVDRLNQEVQALRLRLSEAECGLLRLDERTASGNRRSGEARSTDPCRQNTGAPLRLPSRP